MRKTIYIAVIIGILISCKQKTELKQAEIKTTEIPAWEVELRYATSDLNSENISGGEQSDITLGVNWYLNPSTRIMFNNVWADVKDAGTMNVFPVRFQINF